MEGKKVLVNGALMEKEFFEENLAEARKADWVETDSSKISNHMHCIVCTMALPTQTKEKAYRSGNIWLCEYCYAHYLK